MNPAMNPESVKWDAQGLAPAIVQDALSGEVLMLAWMSRESLQKTLETGLATFWSRSRKELWVKGATSGNTQRVRAVRLDCDSDAILLRVDPAGPACHTGARSCFVAAEPLDPTPAETLAALERVLRSRKENPPEGSYTAKLFASEPLRHKKIGEEATELVMASLKGTKEEIASEAADLFYHALVLLQSHGLGLHEVTEVLRAREGKRRA
ncbi:MAG TPA: bifunctional phosphoribosyl-AMP cyclohydrolase/phosphoribosyl-ATP diphosphatase HisIE [Myxococcales bacterium]